MPLKSGRFSDQETAFIDAYLNVHNGKQAAILAGYSTPQVAGPRTLARPEIVAEIRRRGTIRLHTELVPKAFAHLADTLSSTSASVRDKNQAASIVLKLATADRDDGGRAKEAHEMTFDELAERIRELQQRQTAIADGAKVIEGETIEADPFD